MKFSIVRQKGYEFDETAATQTFGFIAQKRKGKSYAAGVLFEALHALGCQQIVYDNVGNWKALRLDRDGKSPGLPITVFGGPSGDVPLLPESGAMVGRFIMEKRISAILDISRMKDSQMERFVADVCEAIFAAAQDREGDGVCMCYFEEAQRLAPERKKNTRMAEQVELIVRVGGNYGLGSVIISQRPQDVMKGVLNQVECLFVGQLNGKHERTAVEDWIVAQGVDDLKARLKELPTLDRGEFFLWSPSWLGVFARVKTRRKKTFDGSATPKLGAKVQPIKLSRMEVEDVKNQLTGMVDKYNETDPKALRARVAKLERENQELREKPALELKQYDFEPIEELIDAINKVHDLTGPAWAVISPDARKNWIKDLKKPNAQVTPKAVQVTTVKPPKSLPEITQSSETHTKCESTLLGVLSLHGATIQANKSLTQNQVIIMSGYKPSGTTGGALANLRKQGLIVGSGHALQLTLKGEHAAPKGLKLPTGEELLDYWVKELDACSGKILRLHWESPGMRFTLPEICAKTDYKMSGTVGGAMSKLKKLKLIVAAGRGLSSINSEII